MLSFIAPAARAGRLFAAVIAAGIGGIADGQIVAPLQLASTPATRETLADAIALAYQRNPTLQSQRAQMRALDESYVQARSQLGPTVRVDSNVQYTDDRLRKGRVEGVPVPPSTTRADTVSGQVLVDQPLYTGGRVTLEMRAARDRIRAGRETLRATEGDIVFAVIQAFVDLRRDIRALAIRRVNLAAVQSQATEIYARWQSGDLTLTDVAQANAQVAAEEANVASAENQVRASRVAYATVIGRNPGELEAEPPLPNLPSTAEDAWRIAAQASPELQRALYTELQSRAQLQAVRVTPSPTLSLRGVAGYGTELEPLNRYNRNRSLSGALVLSIPLFNSGLTRSQIRQATEVNLSDRAQIEIARRSMLQSVTDAWNQMVTFRANVERQRRQVEAAALAFKGMEIEYRAGQRSTLDLLVAEETLRDAELAELGAEHDAYLSAALVLRYIGRLDAADIVEALPLYDPAANFSRVANRGALPWEPLIRLFDGLTLPDDGQRAIPAPQPAEDPTIAPALSVPSGTAVDEIPTAPIPGTVTNIPPPVARVRSGPN